LINERKEGPNFKIQEKGGATIEDIKERTVQENKEGGIRRQIVSQKEKKHPNKKGHWHPNMKSQPGQGEP